MGKEVVRFWSSKKTKKGRMWNQGQNDGQVVFMVKSRFCR